MEATTILLNTDDGKVEVTFEPPGPYLSETYVSGADNTLDYLDYDMMADAIDEGMNNIELYGWIQHEDGEPMMGFCLQGSIFYTQQELIEQMSPGERDYRFAFKRAVLNYINWYFHQSGWDCLTDWNDYDERSRQEVLDLGRTLAKDLRRRGEPGFGGVTIMDSAKK